MKLCEKIEQIRGDQNSFAFARIIGIEWEDLCRFEIGTKVPDRKTLERIAELGGTTADELIESMDN